MIRILMKHLFSMKAVYICAYLNRFFRWAQFSMSRAQATHASSLSFLMSLNNRTGRKARKPEREFRRNRDLWSLLLLGSGCGRHRRQEATPNPLCGSPVSDKLNECSRKRPIVRVQAVCQIYNSSMREIMR